MGQFVPDYAGNFVDGPTGDTPITSTVMENIEGALASEDVRNPASEAAQALAALYGHSIRAWAPNTNYVAGETVISPTAGDVVAATVTHTSTATYDATKWQAASLAAKSTQRLMAVMKNQTRDASILVVSDSTGVTTDRWIYRFAQLLAPEWPAWTVNFQFWNDTTGAYDPATTLQTGTSGRTLTVYAAAVSGTDTIAWQTTRSLAAIYALTPDVVMVSLGHNEQADPLCWHARYTALSESISTGLPSADMIIIGQNTEDANTYQQQRNELYREIAARRGYGFIDIQQVWLDSGNPTSLNVDGVHPTSAGSALWAATVKQAFLYQPSRAPRTQTPSPLTQAGVNLLQNPQLTLAGGVPTNWSLSNCTAAIDTTNFESASGDGSVGTFASTAVKLTTTATGSLISQFVPLSRVAGRWVTVAFRVYIPAGQATSVGRLGIQDSTGSSLMNVGGGPTGAFRWIVQTRFIPATATYCKVIFYVDASGSTGTLTVDRAIMVAGKYPHGLVSAQAGPQGPAGVAAGQIDYCSTYGSNPGLAMFAATYSGTGIGVGGANQAIYSLVVPHRNMTIQKLIWGVITSSGNYDIGIFDSAGNLLWSKGSTAVPGTGIITETVPSVALTAGTSYFVGMAFDNATVKVRGVSGASSEFVKLATGNPSTLLKSSAFPLATGALGSTPVQTVPVVVLREA